MVTILVLGALAAFVGDVAHMYPLLVQALFFLTPIVYPAEIVPAVLMLAHHDAGYITGQTIEVDGGWRMV